MLVRVGCSLRYISTWPVHAIVMVAVHADGASRIVEEDIVVDPAVDLRAYADLYGNRCWRLTLPEGSMRIVYDALVEVSGKEDSALPDAPQTPVDDLPDEVLVYTLPSRHCQSDRLGDMAWELFGSVPAGWARVQAVCDWLHTNISYRTGSTATTSAVEALEARAGVCRDFAHLGVVFCRALNIPARYVCGYLPDVGIIPPDVPMDFHAWFEAFLDGSWHTFDARHNVPRIGRVPVAYGRDAVDVALATVYGSAQLGALDVWSDEVDEQGLVLSGLNRGQTRLPQRMKEDDR